MSDSMSSPIGPSSYLLSEMQKDALEKLGNRAGLMLLGSFISVILYGFGLHQTYRYFRFFPKDDLSTRVVVVFNLVLATVQTMIHVNATQMITNINNPQALLKAVWLANVIAIVAALGAVTTQGFFAHRASLKYTIIGTVVVLLLGVRLAALEQVAGMTLALEEFAFQAITKYIDESWAIVLTCGSAAILDYILFGFVFNVTRSGRVTNQGNGSWVDFIANYGVNTGFFILLFDSLALIFAIAVPHEPHWANANLIATRVAMNTILCIINSRNPPRLVGDETWNNPQVSSLRIDVLLM
ncbi:hypothetical protein L227DRAFT_352987 [Lentinus tigrinus ALCF2SS1-6]|uniref:Uncharacterized protein n=1 Tax=Lentinus tigrinus ALCF2SS1-6 TaxID=1328759 RepID=A0A5C2RRQ1_9APHY|nr:hypothetical protein L227DRAFT_352987 [Lentinus tigrinus ALCF2SS1-6]